MTARDGKGYSIHELTTSEFSSAVDILVGSFQHEPNHEFFYPDESHRERALTLEFTAGLRDAMRHGLVLVAKCWHSIVGVSVWLKPHSFPLTWKRKLRGLPPFARIALLDSRAIKRLATFTTELERLHPPQPYWYLMAIGVDPAHQGNGAGSALLDYGLSNAEPSDCPCWLETASAKNASWYAQFGFTVVDEKVVLVEGGPPLFTMRRESTIQATPTNRIAGTILS